MSITLFERIARLERDHASFAIATVVARQSPVSSRLGDRALIFADGRMEGFVGGSCSRDIVRRQALGAIRDRQPVLLQIRNARTNGDLPQATGDADPVRRAHAGHAHAEEDLPGSALTERVTIPMSCSSEGAVDVYIEPRVPLRRLVVVGFTPVAQALAQTALALDYNVVRVVIDDESRDLGDAADVRVIALAGLHAYVTALDASERASLVAIVASQGHYDELALEALLAFDIAFVGLLSSRRRAATVLGVLAQQGIASDRLALIRNPVGLDIGARSPGEVAISILAEIIANAPSTTADPPSTRPAADGKPVTDVDPVCGMDVELANALYRAEHAGRTFVFCCAGCRASFSADPGAFLVTRGSA